MTFHMCARSIMTVISRGRCNIQRDNLGPQICIPISFDRIFLCKYVHNSSEKNKNLRKTHIFCFLGVDIQVSKKEM